ncbi:MAG: hypothetical protein SO031_05630 [Candidatus Ventricola sp.]|nr:hypothetical protein [Candidatus Ventricola sp.]
MDVRNAAWVRARLRPRMGRRVAALLLSIPVMGLCVAVFKLTGVGTSPCSCMNLGISGRLGISFGTWQLLLNIALLLIVLRYAPEKISLGTLVNMVFVGYIAEFFMNLLGGLIPETGLPAGPLALVFVLTLAAYLVSASVYLATDLGCAPYDAVPMIIAAHTKRVSYRAIRMVWDVGALSIGFALGATVGIATLITGFCLGPAITAVGARLKGVFEDV